MATDLREGFKKPDLAHIVAPEALLGTFDVDNIPVEALMFQPGKASRHIVGFEVETLAAA